MPSSLNLEAHIPHGPWKSTARKDITLSDVMHSGALCVFTFSEKCTLSLQTCRFPVVV